MMKLVHNVLTADKTNAVNAVKQCSKCKNSNKRWEYLEIGPNKQESKCKKWALQKKGKCNNI